MLVPLGLTPACDQQRLRLPALIHRRTHEAVKQQKRSRTSQITQSATVCFP